MRCLTAILVLLLSGVASAGEWSVNSRPKPGEVRTYTWTTTESVSMLDARACGTTIFSYEKDITAEGNTNSVATLYSCPKIDSVVADCNKITGFINDELSMAVNDKPGFFQLDIHTPVTPSGLARATAFCAREFIAKPNYVRKEILWDANVPAGPQTTFPFHPGGFTRGYFVKLVTNGAAIASFMRLSNVELGTLKHLCVGLVTVGNIDDVTLVGGEGYEETDPLDLDLTGVDRVCKVAFTRDMEIGMFAGAGGVDIELWFYGIPN